MNILSIGNSFSNNAHRFLPQIVAADGRPTDEFMLCNLYIGGCSLEGHWNNWKSEEEAYSYEIYLPGETALRVAEEVALHEAVEDEEWDIITLQQASPLSGIAESFSPYLEELAEYLSMVAPKTRLMLHQTWAYSNSTDKPGFERYASNQDTMFEEISKAYRLAAINSGIEDIIPSGLAWQYARQTSIGDGLTAEDGYHANDFGCYLAGACFYEKCFGRSIMENTFVIPDFSPEYTNLLKICAHAAVEKY